VTDPLDAIQRAFLVAVREGGALGGPSSSNVEATLAPGALSVAEGLAVYRRNFRGAMQRAFEDTYPSVAERAGSEAFERLVALCVTRWPTSDPDLNRYGAELVDAIEAYGQGLNLAPELADLARLEWAWQRVHQAAPPLPPRSPGVPALVSPGVLITSEHPLLRLWLHGAPSTAEAPSRLLVWRTAQLDLRVDPVPEALWPYLVAAAAESESELLDLLDAQLQVIDDETVAGHIADLVQRGWLVSPD